jgi:hypothetical protein
MKLLRITRQDLVDELTARLSKFGMILDDIDFTNIIDNKLQDMDERVSSPRFIFVETNGLQKIELQDSAGVDEVVGVTFEPDADSVQNLLPDVGMYPLFNTGGVLDIESYLIYLIEIDNYKGLQSLSGDAAVWEWRDPNLYLNIACNTITVKFLPFIDDSKSEWYLYNYEKSFLNDIIFLSVMERNSESLMTAQFLGIGKEVDPAYWTTRLEARYLSFEEQASIGYYDALS